MKRLAEITDKPLLEHIARLERDVQDFEHRSDLQKTILERQERFSASEPVYQRLTSIRDYLRSDLRQAERELERRRRDRAPRRTWALRSAVAALFGAQN